MLVFQTLVAAFLMIHLFFSIPPALFFGFPHSSMSNPAGTNTAEKAPCIIHSVLLYFLWLFRSGGAIEIPSPQALELAAGADGGAAQPRSQASGQAAGLRADRGEEQPDLWGTGHSQHLQDHEHSAVDRAASVQRESPADPVGNTGGLHLPAEGHGRWYGAVSHQFYPSGTVWGGADTAYV